MSFTTLTHDQIEAADAWLDELSLGIVHDGQSLLQNGVITGPRDEPAGGFRARVYEKTAMFDPKFGWDGVEWSPSCTCVVNGECKHCVAAMLLALSKSKRAASRTPPPTEPPKPTAAPRRTGDTFVSELSARLGRKLPKDEARAAAAVDSIFNSWRERKEVPFALISSLSRAGRVEGWNDGNVEIWPTPPQTRWETWLYIAGYLEREGIPIPYDWAKVTDSAHVEALLGEWGREQSVWKWRGWLEQAETHGEGSGEQLIELRAMLTSQGIQLEWRRSAGVEFRHMPITQFQQLLAAANSGDVPIEEGSMPIWNAFNTGYGATPLHVLTDRDGVRILNRILRDPAVSDRVLGENGQPLKQASEPLKWRSQVTEGTHTDYHFNLVRADGTVPPPALIVLNGNPPLYLTAEEVFACPRTGGLDVRRARVSIPAEAMETPSGVTLLERLGTEAPERLATRVRTTRLRPLFECRLIDTEMGHSEHLAIKVYAESEEGAHEELYTKDGWEALVAPPKHSAEIIYRRERQALTPVPDLLTNLKVSWWPYDKHWQKGVGKKFAEQFTAWMATVPAEVTLSLDPALASLRDPTIPARVKLDVSEAGIDWFDVRIALDVPDTTLTKAEIKALLDARGGFVRLGAKGWRRLTFQLSEEDESQLADLGLSTSDFSGEPQRLHALQLAGKAGAKRMLSDEHTQAIERRAEEIRTRVSPPIPPQIKAELRPYQVEGFHFLAYLSTNRFGGILADDMGLGKTLQTLTWLTWLRQSAQRQPSLVVCPKSVTDNWRSEAAHFAPDLRVCVLQRGATADSLAAAREGADLVVANYAQLRSLEPELTAAPWMSVILDEAQAIKNPESQTARAAWKLNAAHRLALSGTPIENRLLDLWSIMQFAMPGALGPRATFSKNFDQRTDPLARRRLSARVRPFVLRRTKSEVAKDLPERIEEDLLCELDGPQATLYSAELKRARASLLKLNTQAQLDKARFNVLTSLLRLRQICCHPALISEKSAKHESAKLSALLELLEPLVAEGHKVLVFSQFVEMLSIIRQEIQAREWRHFVLTGETEDRGTLVADFQKSEGSAVFLISLRAGGFGLNLTAASYVVLFDPWWNPAVENQAIDRTHRIGQRNTVIAYRLLVKATVEEKIRALQTQKNALASDVLGEESFARALTLDDFRFLLGEE